MKRGGLRKQPAWSRIGCFSLQRSNHRPRLLRHRLPFAAQLRREHSILSSLSSPHIVRCLGTDVTREGGKEYYNLFMEYFPRGTLCDEIRNQGGRLPEPEISRHSRSVLLGLRYLHGIGIAHRDIKGSNLLVGCDGEVRIGDLGCALRTGVTAEVGGLAGTPLFMAPEVARAESQGSAADVWALGCTMVEMATGQPPWAAEVTDPISALYRIGCTDAVPEIPENLSEEGQDFLAKCFCRNPLERLVLEENWVCMRAEAPENLPMPSISGEPDFEQAAIESTTGRDIDANIDVETTAAFDAFHRRQLP
ncbi:Mitogen-activated protein kinase kinase kinase 3 [Nymphaea thermarum]|nr:Mitogen-activated protein kinase kinase kinase 3 [Nymphaea thermarum]